MRVVVLADFAEPSGGAQRVAIDSARALAEAGTPVTYVHAIGTQGNARLDHPLVTRVGLGLPDIWDRPTLKALPAGLWNRAAGERLGEVLATLPTAPTVLHLHQWTRAFSPAALSACLDAQLPVVITLHDYFLACPNGVYYRFDKDEPCALRPLSASCLAAPCDPRSALHKAVRVLRTAVTRRLLRGRRLDLIHVSDRGRDTIMPFLPERLGHHRVDNPVAALKGRPAAINPDAKIAYIGRLTREKGADLAALAAKRAGIPLMLVGEGPLEAEIRKINPEADVLGWRKPDEVAALMQTGVRAVVAPSRWYETGPLTVYEAAACGVPAVVSDCAGAAERVAHGETGFVVPPDVEALAKAFRALQDGEIVRRLGLAAHAGYWAAPPTSEAHARRLLQVYASALDRFG